MEIFTGLKHPDDNKICELLSISAEEGMTLLFDLYYKRLVLWADTFLNDLALAEDVVQEFFIAIWHDKSYLRFRPETLPAFLHVSIRNRCYHRLEKHDILKHITTLEQIDLIFDEYNQQHDLIVACIWKEINKLPKRSKEIMYGVFVEGLKYREIAERYHISPSTVKTLLKNALERLRKNLPSTEALELFLFILWEKSSKSKYL